MSNKIRVISSKDKVWNPSSRTLGWEYVRFSGAHGGPFTVQARCPAGVFYHTWVSNKLVEHYVLEGTMTINGIELEKGDYIGIEANEDGYISTKTGMETLAIIHGDVVFADEVFDSLKAGTLTIDRADELTALPWMDHLRRHAQKHIETMCDFISKTSDETLIRFCINVARDISSPRFVQLVKQIMDGEPGFHLRLSATLYLGAKGEMDESRWNIQLTKLAARPDELIEITKKVYSSRDNKNLLTIIESRIKKYPGNEKIYKLLIHLVNGGVGLPEGLI